MPSVMKSKFLTITAKNMDEEKVLKKKIP